MAAIDRDLVRAVNSGRCFVLVGAGPSCEIGLPSWSQLAEMIVRHVAEAQKTSDAKTCQTLLNQRDYPSVFTIAERALGQQELLRCIDAALSVETQTGRVYQYVASWPFSCYLTTNFDDHLTQHLKALGIPVVMRRNSQQDIRALRADSRDLVVKIHGDTTVPEDIVLTMQQYRDFREDDRRQYWRDKILSVLNMVDVVIIGYSAQDPDFRDQLERAKRIASPIHPVFMFAADLQPNQVIEYYQQFNIRIISYDNKDRTHRELYRLLARYDPFIAKRESPSLGLAPIDESTATVSASMYLFTQLRLIDNDDVCIQQIYSSLILQMLDKLSDGSGVRIKDLYKQLGDKTFAASNADPATMHKALEALYSSGYVSLSADRQIAVLEPRGRDVLSTVRAQRDLVREQFEESCRLFLGREYPSLPIASTEAVIEALHTGIVHAYEKRGMEIARSVFGGDVIDISDATDLLEIINQAGSVLSSNNERSSFADLMIEVMLKPNQEMKQFLALISQGYFAYHALGLEPKCSRERLRIAAEKKWILDSSVLLPMLALKSLNHSYAVDLLDRMRHLGLICYTTERLFDEIRDHAWWAITNFAHVSPDAPILLQAAIAGPGYRQNLFLDGFMKWSLSQGSPSFSAYMRECLGPDCENDLNGAIRGKITDWGVQIMAFSQWPEFSADSWPERDDTAMEIEKIRRHYGTFRRESQCIAEAEVVLACEEENAAFLSQSGVLNRLSRKGLMTLKPEAMYRFLSLFSTGPVDSAFLYDCMIQEFYSAGFDIVDRNVIAQFVGPMVRQARMQLDQEKRRYEQALGQRQWTKFREDFEQVPDEQKPFYSMQFAFYVAAREVERRKKAEDIAQQAQQTKRLTDGEKKELEYLRAKRDEKRKKEEKRRRRARSRPKRK